MANEELPKVPDTVSEGVRDEPVSASLFAGTLERESPEKFKEMTRYEDVASALAKAYPRGLRVVETSAGGPVYGSVAMEKTAPLVWNRREYHALLLTPYGFFIMYGIPKGAGLEDYTEKVIPAVRASFEQDIPEGVLHIPHDRAAAHSETGRRALTLERVNLKSEVGLRMFRDGLLRAEEEARGREDAEAWVRLDDPVAALAALRPEQSEAPLK